MSDSGQRDARGAKLSSLETATVSHHTVSVLHPRGDLEKHFLSLSLRMLQLRVCRKHKEKEKKKKVVR